MTALCPVGDVVAVAKVTPAANPFAWWHALQFPTRSLRTVKMRSSALDNQQEQQPSAYLTTSQG